MEIDIRPVRLSFESIYDAADFQGDGNFKYKATFLVPKNSGAHKDLEDAIYQTAEAKWGKKAREVLDSIKIGGQKHCMADGDSPDKSKYDGFAGHIALATSNEQRPTVVNRTGGPVVRGENQAPYDGCFVLAKVQIWAQDNQYGKAIRASLLGVQFDKDGDSFGASRVAAATEFADLSEGTEEGTGEAALM